MKTAAIVSIGTEIMRGKIDDTNSTFISRWLKECGIFLKYRTNVSDEIDEIVKSINYVKDSDLIILTGGLGPTDDDITREALAKYLEKRLILNEKSWEKIKSYFTNKNLVIAKSNERQAYLIEGGEHIPNDRGTAPGVFYRDNDKIFVLLPGPPGENQIMVKNWLFNKLKEAYFIEGEIFTKVYRLYNIGESSVADIFLGFKEDVEIGYYFTKSGWVEIHLSSFVKDSHDIESIMSVAKRVEKLFNDNNVFFTDDEDLSTLVLKLLISKNKTLAFGESITGGNISGEFVKNPSSSKVLLGSIVSYSNEVKKDLLSVSDQSLKNFGAVSEAVVNEMCYGLKDKIKADINVCISGIAGPEGGSEEKPVGLVYFGFLFDDKFIVKKEIFNASGRLNIINRCINYVYCEILKYYR